MLAMSPELSKKLVAAVDNVPAFPRSVRKILELAGDGDCTPKDLVQLINQDPVVTVKILRVVNSACYSLPKQIRSIHHAVVYLGFNTIKNLALSIAAIGVLPASNAAGFDGQQYLIHSLSTGGIAKQIGLRVDEAEPMDCFIAGLLHDFGKVVLAQFMPQEFRLALQTSQLHRTSLHAALNDLIGADHSVVGAMLVEKWRFPADLIETLRHQYTPALMDTPMIACVFTANQVSKKLAFGFGGNAFIGELPPCIVNRLGGTLDEIIASLGDLTSVFEDARLFSKM